MVDYDEIGASGCEDDEAKELKVMTNDYIMNHSEDVIRESVQTN